MQRQHHRFIVEELHNACSIHANNRFEEESQRERIQYLVRIVDLARDFFYSIHTPAV